nr:hypothetical protein BaRGS_008618 [Batillaria attramentaria]
MKQHLDYCSGRTLEVSLELINAYLRPPACSPFDEGNEDPSSLTTGGSSAVKQCMQDTQWISYLPDVSKYLTVIDDVCETVDDINYTCVIDAMEKFTTCASEKADITNFNGWENLKEGVCQVFQFTYDCMKQHLDYCSGRTLEVSLELINAYLRPPACSPFDEGNEDPSSLTTGGSSDTNYACVINVTEKLVVCASEKGDTMNINGPEAQKEGVCHAH